MLGHWWTIRLLSLVNATRKKRSHAIWLHWLKGSKRANFQSQSSMVLVGMRCLTGTMERFQDLFITMAAPLSTFIKENVAGGTWKRMNFTCKYSRRKQAYSSFIMLLFLERWERENELGRRDSLRAICTHTKGMNGGPGWFPDSWNNK